MKNTECQTNKPTKSTKDKGDIFADNLANINYRSATYILVKNKEAMKELYVF